MKAPVSFEHTVDEYHFIFARICSDEEVADQYSVMTGDVIFRMVQPKEGDPYVFKEGEQIPDDLYQLEQQLSDVIHAHNTPEPSQDQSGPFS